jgi:hypothetical protein
MFYIEGTLSDRGSKWEAREAKTKFTAERTIWDVARSED